MECDKKSLRSRMRARRALPADPAHSAAACERVLGLDAYRSAETVLCYHSVGGEVDTHPLMARMRAEGKTVCLPAGLGGGIMEARRADGLKPGPLGIPNPAGPLVAPEKIDLIIVPGLSFDRTCHRLGQGGGYYDRYLPRCRAVTIGLAFEWQMTDCLPLEAHDAPLHFVATEAALYIRPEGP